MQFKDRIEEKKEELDGIKTEIESADANIE